VAVVVPALDEEEALPGVLSDLAGLGLLGRAVVVDNGSRDRTAAIAAAAGALVAREPVRGYGAACLKGISAVARELPDSRVIVFMDADRSDDPGLIPDLCRPLVNGRADLVIGSRSKGLAEPGSLLPHQRIGNAVACGLIALLYGHRYTDLGPFRAVTIAALSRMKMRDTGFGWTVEMQVRAIRAGLRVVEIPVPYRPRVGTSKISGTISGSFRAAIKIGWTVARLRLGG
jgi:glycosyltransferase involved in cell wall biosynthesis